MKNDPDLQLISVGLNSYFIRGSEIVETNLETIDSSLTQNELDKILALSEKERASPNGPQVLHFILHGLNIVLEKTSSLDQDPLYQSNLGRPFIKKWPQTLRGISCSPGLVTAVCVRLSTFDQNKAQGKILIIPTLNIRDVKSLDGIKGILLEKGSILSHLGVLAREKNIPCIIGLKDAQLIPDGEVIKLDAFSGLVSPAT